MSRAGTRIKFDAGIEVDVAWPLAVVQGLNPALAGAVDNLLYDMVSHHRLSVGKHNKLPGKRSAQQWWFSRSFRHATNVAKKGPPAGGIGAISAGSFAAARSGQTFGDDRFQHLEFGERVTSPDWFVVPIGPWRARSKRKQLLEMLKGRTLQVTPSGYLIKGKGRGKRMTGTELVGVLTRRRQEKPVLRFYPEWERVSPKHLAGLDKIAAAAISGSEKEAQRVVLRSNVNRAASSAFTRAYFGARAQRMGPAQARQVARAAAAEARKVSRGLLVGGG